ncbi:hypothetical protein RHMOL_Rhmol01G0316600 [Rhododendron molle]|uniref:Uncharacterized protein n=1 Tax=Rhododendron molle TaxID=49168 RepID=A0ACC0Q863_RHOML|nr:hypothetical protein RHMOL_Rhmol01G0316600 [Rhododendron molle]
MFMAMKYEHMEMRIEHLHAFINDILEEEELLLSAWDAMVSKYDLEAHTGKILKRWTRDAKAGIVKDFKGREVEGDNKLKVTNRYRMLCPELVKLTSRAAECEEASALVASYLNEMFEKSKGLKKKQAPRKGNKKPKSWTEKQGKKKKGGSAEVVPNEESFLGPTMAREVVEVYNLCCSSIKAIIKQLSIHKNWSDAAIKIFRRCIQGNSVSL